MKTRIITIFLLLVILIALVLHNKDALLSTNIQSKVLPLKKSYLGMSNNLADWFDEYIAQGDSIKKYKKENDELKLQLANQLNYIDESKKLYKVFPTLKKINLNNNIDVVQTLSYVKFNNFSQIILSRPESLKEGIIYGLIQNGVVGGIARIENNQLIGYLANNEKSRFSVFVGSKNAPGIVIGSGSRYATIQFIPKWFDIKNGDKVITSGLDGIFYGNLPVGVVNKVELQGNFKVAQVDLYCDLYHPNVYYLVKNIKPVTLNSFLVNYNNAMTNMSQQTQVAKDTNATMPTVSKPSILSSTPTVEIDQTKAYEVDTSKQQTTQNQPTSSEQQQSPAPKKKDNQSQQSQNSNDGASNNDNTDNQNPVGNLDILNQ